MTRLLPAKPSRRLLPILVVAGVLVAVPNGSAHSSSRPVSLKPRVSKAVAFDASPSLRVLAARHAYTRIAERPLPPERGPFPVDHGFTGDRAVQSKIGPPRIPSPLLTFEGLANTDNPFQVSPPDPVGDVGPNNYVEMVNIVFAIYSKTGARILGPLTLDTLWQGFPVTDCADLSGDPIVLHDQLDDRWILTQLTSRGPTFYDCVAISQTPDPTGPYFRYAFSSGVNFPDYPKYGVWPDAYFLSTREFAPDNSFAGDGVYALERDRMLDGDPGARMVKFLLTPGTKPYLPGDGLLPSTLDGQEEPPSSDSPNFFMGTMDDGAGRGAVRRDQHLPVLPPVG